MVALGLATKATKALVADDEAMAFD